MITNTKFYRKYEGEIVLGLVSGLVSGLVFGDKTQKIGNFTENLKGWLK